MPRNGSAISSPPDTSLSAMLTSDQFSLFDLTTCGPIVSATSSPASEVGVTPCGLPDGTTRDLFGREVVLASRSRSPAKTPVERTSGTYGRIGSHSSASADLAWFLASRLMRRLDGGGSTLFSGIWRRKVTPRGRAYWEHTASARRTSGSECGSWPTPDAAAGNLTDRTWMERREQSKIRHGNGNGFGLTIGQAVQ